MKEGSPIERSQVNWRGTVYHHFIISLSLSISLSLMQLFSLLHLFGLLKSKSNDETNVNSSGYNGVWVLMVVKLAVLVSISVFVSVFVFVIVYPSVS